MYDYRNVITDGNIVSYPRVVVLSHVFQFGKFILVSDAALPEGDAQVKLGHLLPLLQVCFIAILQIDYVTSFKTYENVGEPPHHS